MANKQPSETHKSKGGRPKGSPNKATIAARTAIAAFVDGNASRLQEWLNRIAKEEGPLAAFQCVERVLEYHVPKLQRTELTGKDGKELTINWPVPPPNVER